MKNNTNCTCTDTDVCTACMMGATAKKEGNPMEPKLRDNYHLFVPEVADAKDYDAIKKALVPGTPMHVAFNGGGNVILNTQEIGDLCIPVRKVRLERVQIQAVTVTEGDQTIVGVAIRLPEDLARLQTAYEATLSDVKGFSWLMFLDYYKKDMMAVASRHLRRTTFTRVNGRQAHALSDPRVGEREIGLTRRDAKKLAKTLGVPTVEGMWMLLQRFPVAGEESARWVTVVILEDRASGPIYVNALTWQWLQGGDEDGDMAYVGTQKPTSNPKARKVDPFPNLLLGDNRPVLDELVAGWKPNAHEDRVNRVMAFLTKDLVAPLTYSFHCLRSGAASEYALGGKNLAERVDRVLKANRAILRVLNPLTERVMDGRKLADKLDVLFAVADVLQDGVNGKLIRPEPYFPFLGDAKLEENLKFGMKLAGYSIETARKSASGSVIAAGKKILTSGPHIIEALLAQKISADQILTRIQQDALGENLLFIERKDKKGSKGAAFSTTEENETEIGEDTVENTEFAIRGTVNKLALVLPSIHLGDKPIFRNCQLVQLEDGTMVAKAQINPFWTKWYGTNNIEVTLPKVKEMKTRDGHAVIEMPNQSDRLYRPSFELVNGQLTIIGFEAWLAGQIMLALQDMKDRKRKFEAPLFMEVLAQYVRQGVQTLTISEPKEDLVRIFEYGIQIKNTGSIRGNWEEREKILRVLDQSGFDICTTSKNSPGTLVTKANEHGLPSYMLAGNPFAKFLDLKRRVEVREVRASLELANPCGLPVRTKGYSLPKAFHNSIAVLRVMVGDFPGVNVFEGPDGEIFCHDTLICCPSILKKMAIAEQSFDCATAEERDQKIEDLLENGIALDQITTEPKTEELAPGMLVHTWVVKVAGPIEDLGKIKALVGPIKGIMNIIPVQLFDAAGNEIDLVVPRMTMIKKKALDAAFEMGFEGEEYDPNSTLEETAALCVENRSLITAIYEDGRDNQELGEATVGLLPFYRPVQTGMSCNVEKFGENGIKVQTHAMIVAKHAGNEVRFDTPSWVNEEFTQALAIHTQVSELKNSMIANAPDMDVPMPDESYIPA